MKYRIKRDTDGFYYAEYSRLGIFWSHIWFGNVYYSYRFVEDAEKEAKEYLGRVISKGVVKSGNVG